MKRLSDLLSGVDIIQQSGDSTVQIRGIQYDSREVSPGDLFVAIKGGTYDGHEYIDAAIRRRASAVVGNIPPPDDRIPYVQVGNTRKALAEIATAFYGHPGRSLSLIGITGTNGKTSTAFLIESILKQHGLRTGLLGTVMYRIGDEDRTADWTTPESTTLQQLLAVMLKATIETVVMELSSHALDQYRAEGLAFRLAVFTNLTQDHLDYHRSMADYAAAKQRLFAQVDAVKGENIINGDDTRSREMVLANHRPVFTYSATTGKADVFPVSAEYSSRGSILVLRTPDGDIVLNTPLPGKHNVDNIMAAVSAGICLNISLEQIQNGIEAVSTIPGRLEHIDEGQPFSVLVDYAHTPDAMENVITSLKQVTSGNLIVLFGCGGDRDKEKRPMMGSIADTYADAAILTTDNPRTEDPEQIIQDTLQGVTNRDKMMIVPDRSDAIQTALDRASDDDCVMILGKGHEQYQLIGKEKLPFDDRQIAREFLHKKYN